MTHYEVLGVDPGAGIDEIRAAYRARARELHPDHRTAGTDDAGEMAAVNQAWAVLGDAERRTAYDAQLRHGQGRSTGAGKGPPGRPGAPPGAGAPGGAFVATGPGVGGGGPRHGAGHEPPVHAALPGCLGAGALPWIVVVVVLVVIFVFTAYAGSGRQDPPTPSGSDPGPPLVAVRDVRGLCIRVAGGITSAVDCLTVPNEGRIVAQAAIGASCPEGTDEWLLRQLDTLACTERIVVGRP